MGDVIDDGALESIWQYCGCASNEKKGLWSFSILFLSNNAKIRYF